MSEDAQFTHAHMVRFERLLPGPPDRTWAVLTDTGRLPGWYGEAVLEPRVGGRVDLMKGHIKGVITQWQPPKKLAYTWNVFMPGQQMSDYPELYLTLELSPQGDGTKLTLAHLPVLENFVKLNAMGWHIFLDMVSAAVRGDKIEAREVYMKRNAPRYGVDPGKLPS